MLGAFRSKNLWLGLIAVVAVPAILLAQTPAAPPAQTLERLMSQINRAYRTVKSGAADKTKNDATLAALAQMQTATLSAKGMTPTILEKAPEAEKAPKLAEYHKEMLALLRTELDLEDVILAGENAKAADVIAKIDDLQKKGHAQFRPEN